MIAGAMSNFGFTVPTSGYDDEDRLVGWNRANGHLDQSWNLSLVGDWNRFTENATTHSRSHGSAHEILTAATQTFAHNVRGKQTGLPSTLTTSTSGLTLDGDFEDKLASADVDADGASDILHTLDAVGRRIAQDDGTTPTIYVPSGQPTIADDTAGTAASSPTNRYVYASHINEPVLRAGIHSTAKLYYHRNGQYSVTALTDAAGTISERYAYDAYGKLTVTDGSGTLLSGSAYGNRYTYTGQEWDGELGLYHYRARMYDPVAGRFVSRDPSGYVDGMSLYRGYFVGRGVDPLGNQAVNCAALHQECLGCVQETKDDCDLRAHGFCFISCVVGGKRCKGGLGKGGLFTLCYGICTAAYIASCDRQVTNGTTGRNAALSYCNANGEWPGVFRRR